MPTDTLLEPLGMRRHDAWAAGYRSEAYAASLAEFGTPQELPRCGGWILRRPIANSRWEDAMGCYPLFACADWTQVKEDCEALPHDLVALSLVTEPFGNYDEPLLRDAFNDVVQPFKTHFVADLREPATRFVSKHHQYYAQRALKHVVVDLCARSAEIVDEWTALYDCLIKRYGLRGIKAFSKASFTQQLAVPGITIFRAQEDRCTTGMHLWFTQGDAAISHLMAANERGYDLMVAYALYWSAVTHFAGRIRWLDFGGGAGLSKDAIDGLTQFKRGWANDIRTTFLCGRIFDRARYRRLCERTKTTNARYFPAYREGELA